MCGGGGGPCVDYFDSNPTNTFRACAARGDRLSSPAASPAFTHRSFLAEIWGGICIDPGCLRHEPFTSPATERGQARV